LTLYQEGQDEQSDDEESRRLPTMSEGEILQKQAIESSQHFTEPPPRFSEAALVKRMEELSIGRPSTYASILQVLQDRGYVRLDKKRLIPEDKGRVVVAFLESFFTRYVEYDFTAGLEEKLDDVAAHSRYAQVPSVTALRLGSALCLPMRLESRTLGAVFLARHDRAALDERTLAELRILAAIAVPFLAQLRTHPRPSDAEQLCGESPAVATLRALIRRVGPSDLSVVLHGPSGSGKELVARAIHAASPRADRPMIAINCASVAPTLLDSELFGYRKGAFTGAMTDRVGLIEAAHGSTLFLDEIGDMPLTMQAAMLRVLEQREVKRLGDNVPRAVDFRLICATHKDLEAEVAAGRFRADLLFRLREVTLEIPPLAARQDDIVLLAHTFLRQAEVQLGLVMHTLLDDALAALRAYSWPGNVRELKAAMRRVAILADSKLIRASDLGFAAPKSGQLPAPQTRPLPTGAAAAVRELIDTALASPTQPLATVRDYPSRSTGI
jgi:transcriptional regulator with AAA-type ATPase domain